MQAVLPSLSGLQPSRILGCQVAENEFQVTYEPLKHRVLDFTQVAFWDGQEEENEFLVPGDNWKHRFLDHIIVEFLA